MIDFTKVGAFAAYDANGTPHVQFALYLPGVRATDGYSVMVRIIHSADRFNPSVKTQDQRMSWVAGSNPDLWTTDVELAVPTSSSPSHSGEEGEYLYRFQLLWTPPDGAEEIISAWFADPVARTTDIGLFSTVILSASTTPFAWTDAAYTTPDLLDLVVYELQVEEFNDSFDGVIDRLEYLAALGVNCLELMPVTSPKVEFDWGYGPLHHFAPSGRFGGRDGLKRLVNAAHGRGIAVILDVVYEHFDPDFAYCGVYGDIAASTATVKPLSPVSNSENIYGFGPAADFAQPFVLDFFTAATAMWLDEYHVDGFRYDEVTDLYVGDRAAGYQQLVQRVYNHTLTIPRFRAGVNSYSRVIQCAEALGISKTVMSGTWTNTTWTNDLLYKAEDMIQNDYVDDAFAHILDPSFSGYPASQTVVDTAGNSIVMPVAPFQYLESHDHSQLIVFAGTVADGGPLPEGDRDLYYKLQPYAIALYSCAGVPMLWQGQELADNYNLPDNGMARVHLRRDTHWEFFYDTSGQPLIRLYRRLGLLRQSSRALRSMESYYYYLQSHQQTEIIAYHRHAVASGAFSEEWAFVLLNFADSAASITVPFPKAGTWREVIDADTRSYVLDVAADADSQTVQVPSNYGMIFIRDVQVA